MKAEALRRMQALELQLSQEEVKAKPVATNEQVKDAVVSVEEEEEEDFPRRVAVSNAPRKTETIVTNVPTSRARDEANLLDGTRWKVMLNIGREPGTFSKVMTEIVSMCAFTHPCFL